MILEVRHTGMVVASLDISLAFYTGLGLQLMDRRREKGSYIDAVVGLKDADLEWAKLSAADGAVLELIQYHSHPESPGPTASQRHGCSHLSYTVEDIQDAAGTVQSLGGRVVGQPALDPAGRHRVVYCADPDGILLEIVEEVP